MDGRFNPSRLIGGLLTGLRHRSGVKEEKPDNVTRTILIAVPVAVGTAVVVFGWRFTGADQILAGAALLSGSLLAAFAQIASWRGRVLERGRNVEQVDIRALNEATAHVLVSLMVSVFTVFATFILANLTVEDDSPTYVFVIATSASVLCAVTFTYIGLSIFIVANLLWDAYNNEEKQAKRESRANPRPGD